MTELNRFLFHLVNKVWTSPALDPCMIFLGSINDYGVIWLVLLGVLLALSGKTGRWAALAGLVTLVAGLTLGGVEEYRDTAQALRLTTRRAASGRPTALVLLPLRKHDVRFRRLERGVAHRPAFARPRTGLGLGVSSPCGRRLLLARLRGRALSW